MSQQLLYGEPYRIEAEEKEWLKIRTAHDDYPCWIERKQAEWIDEAAYLEQVKHGTRALSLSFRGYDEQGNPLNLVAGTLLPPAASPWVIKSEEGVSQVPLDGSGKGVVRTAMNYLHTPYLWGGRSPFGLDCSGFVQMLFLLHGLTIQRDASDQVEEGVALSSLDECRAGDLAFFHNEKGRVVHVGVLTEEQRIVHASGKVRIDPIDEKGILPQDREDHTHELAALRRPFQGE